MSTIKSWTHRTVRIKREYIKLSEPEIDEDKSDYDDEGNIINTVYEKPYYYIDTPNAMNGVFWSDDILNDTFYVQYDCYGVDLWSVKRSVWYNCDESIDISELPEPVHLIILRESGYPYMWDAKYFEIIQS